MEVIRILKLSLLLVVVQQATFAKMPLEKNIRYTAIAKAIVNGCDRPTSSAILDINNVRTLILADNMMWWDRDNSVYEVPKRSIPSSTRAVDAVFCGSLWIGGLSNGIVKFAGQTYGQTSVLGQSWWSGPLNVATATTSQQACVTYDQFWKIERAQIDLHVANTIATGIASDPYKLNPNYTPPAVFLNWPAVGNSVFGHASNLAAFIDIDADGIYEPLKGDYPDVLGDQCVFNITNDAGNVNGAGSASIGLEVHNQAFAFVSANEINDMTFYRSKVINRSSNRLDSCYMGLFIDPDLGNSSDDYLGCDVPRNLAMVYNGDEDDEATGYTPGYGVNPPAVGFDLFEGPYSDSNDGIDNDRDGSIDEIDLGSCDSDFTTEHCAMTSFRNIGGGASFPFSFPENAQQAYFTMQARFTDGTKYTYGGNGFGGSLNASMFFPGKSDLAIGWSVGGTIQNPVSTLPEWSELTSGNVPGDRKMVFSSGSFSLEAGAINYITHGVVYGKAQSGGVSASIQAMLDADTKAQALFDNCFSISNGPDAPDLKIVELDQNLLFQLVFDKNSNNYNLEYSEPDVLANALNKQNPSLGYDENYKFQGVLVYQLISNEVTAAQLLDPEKARLVHQCDIKDNVKRIVNYVRDPSINLDLSVAQPSIAADSGMVLSFALSQDAFTQKALVNNKSYYFMAVSYAYNNYLAYNSASRTGQHQAYLQGRHNVKVTTALPHKVEPTFGGMVLNAQYGDMPQIVRHEGLGNGGAFLKLMPSTEAEILENGFAQNLRHQPGYGPINVMVVDPVHLVANNYTLSMYNSQPGDTTAINNRAKWFITYNNDLDTIFSQSNISNSNEQLLHDLYFNTLGLSVRIKDRAAPGKNSDSKNGFIDATISYDNSSMAWLQGLPDVDVLKGSDLDWIKAGKASGDYLNDYNEAYEQVLPNNLMGHKGGTWTLYGLASINNFGPALESPFNNNNRPYASLWSRIDSTVHSVDVVFTNDKNLWSQCLVIETGANSATTQGNQKRLRPRINSGDIKQMGFGTFPGYAIDVETGERLNIMFGEDSSDPENNGTDMFWNPTASQEVTADGTVKSWGGSHFLYIMKSRYDGAVAMQRQITKNHTNTTISNANDTDISKVYANVMWLTIPKIMAGSQFLATKARVSLRVNRNYGESEKPAINALNHNNPVFSFSTVSLAPSINHLATAKSALDLINVVPNPYYGYSTYEGNTQDTRVRITNLPQNSSISIYNLGGSLVRTINKNSQLNFVEWDIKNNAGKPVAAGAYIIHINAPGIGEKVIKWFGILRQQE